MLVLSEPRADVRERFLSSAVSAPTQPLDPLFKCWERSRALGLAADRTAHVDGVGTSELCERRERLESLLRAESTLLGPIAKDFAARSLLSVLADRDGVVLHRHGGGSFTDAASLVRLVEGARWSEDVRGTNAIGTALIEQGPVAVLGGAHFERSNAGLFCYATPVRDMHGSTVCVLDVTGPVQLHDAAVGVAVRAAGAALELVLRTVTLSGAVEGGLAALQRIVSQLHQPAFVVDVCGRLICENPLARPLLQQLEDSRGELARQMPLWTAHAARSGRIRADQSELTLEPIVGPDGRTAALLVVASPRTAIRTPAAASDQPAALAAIRGRDPALGQAKERAARIARTELPVLLLAETGTGKELLARAIHALSPRASGPFIALNCGAVAGSLLESELFGYAPHAFTGASRVGAEGKIAAAHGGTLFLDEIADMPGPVQAALLRFLDDGTYYRVGESKGRRSSVRIVCATCRDLPRLVQTGEFRQDLFFRVQGAIVRPPPLRLRADRIWLAEQLLRDTTDRPLTLTRSASAHIVAHSWPGNVRELKSALEHAAALAPGHLIERDHFPEPLLAFSSTGLADASPCEPAQVPQHSARGVKARSIVLREAVDEAMRVTNGNLSEAARRLRMARSTLYRILQKPAD